MKKKLFSGLPTDLDNTTKELEKEFQKVIIRAEKRSYGKLVTILEGIDPLIAKDTLKNLKQKLGCGGTYKDNIIELQGDHREKIKKLLIDLGYKEDNIEVSTEIE
ncbi:protein translation factor SUI1 [Nanobdella aerobiophila]|uniref:Protein translation factor SUI1 n=1 Tax=Nanobdella aerobiophila TaxID=2586965 RepID=A0A915SFR8_9ARCH|nr:stress response translation initiation inhibitor YciH [Nanobdella aerobiophila]BBL45584.1 protein translation factor SUI1 [Nanobdella aerobiophila]